MYRAITFLTISIAALLFLNGCDIISSDEAATDVSDYYIEAIEKTVPVTPGNLITKTDSDINGNITVDYYNSTGNLVESFLVNDKNEIVNHSVMTYTEDNKLQIKEDISPEGNKSSVEAYQYDEAGNISSKSLHDYSDNMLQKSITYDSSGEATQYTLYKYNEDETISMIEIYDNNNIKLGYHCYEYDNNGVKTKYSSYDDKDVLLSYTTYSYNNAGKTEYEKNYSGNGELSDYICYSYYSNGLLESAISFDSDGNILSEEYFKQNQN